MDSTKRKTLMRELAAEAKREDARGDVVRREQLATTWAELATDAEIARAPKFLRWRGRRD